MQYFPFPSTQDNTYTLVNTLPYL